MNERRLAASCIVGGPPSLRFAASLLIAVALAACGSNLVKPGPAVADSHIALDTPIAWTNYRNPRSEIWTIDGLLLDRVEFFSAIRDGEHVFKLRRVSKNKPDGPYFKPGMDGAALQQLVIDGLAEAGALKVSAANLRPARFGPAEGVRFELQLSNGDGLNYRATALAAEVDGKLNLMIYLAPSEHYFDAYAPAVEQMMRSARPKR